jgi:hypothetical protein
MLWLQYCMGILIATFTCSTLSGKMGLNSLIMSFACSSTDLYGSMGSGFAPGRFRCALADVAGWFLGRLPVEK